MPVDWWSRPPVLDSCLHVGHHTINLTSTGPVPSIHDSSPHCPRPMLFRPTITGRSCSSRSSLGRQLRHHFGPFFSTFLSPTPPHTPVGRVLLGAQAYLMLIGACNPMLCPIWGFRYKFAMDVHFLAQEYGNFDIILDHFWRSTQSHSPHTRRVLCFTWCLC